jgi:hypothetical protein
LTAESLLRDLVAALDDTDYWSPKLRDAEKAARAFLDARQKRKIKK